MRKAHNDRVGGWALIDRHLRLRGDGLPRLLVYSTCRNLIRTLPALQRSAARPEDIITSPKQDDHPADALRYLLQLLVGGGHDRTARDADREPTAGADHRDFVYDTNLITANRPCGESHRGPAFRRLLHWCTLDARQQRRHPMVTTPRRSPGTCRGGSAQPRSM